MYILGISAYYHDSAACLLSNEEIMAAAQEERFTRIKNDANFPSNAIQFCINSTNIDYEKIDYIVFYDKPFLKFERILETYMAFAPKGFKNFKMSMPLWIKDKLFQKSNIINEFEKLTIKNIDWNKKIIFSEHHLSHASSAFFPSPFEEAAILTMDGVGEWCTSSIAVGKGNSIEILKEQHFPHSLGLLYSAFTYHAGFKVNSGEYKLMGLAPYGEPKYINKIRDNLIDIKEDGSFFLNMDYFDFCTSDKMTNYQFDKLFNKNPRIPESDISNDDMDLAASIQKITEEVIIKISRHIKSETNQNKICLAGGVALNCVANGLLLKEKIFDDVWVQPAAGDAGGSIGAAYAAYYLMLNNSRSVNINEDKMKGSYLGKSYNNYEVRNILDKLNAKYTEESTDVIIAKTAKYIADGNIVGWMNGKMEFGPRALGNRSILADPRKVDMQKNLNLKIKFRESFRPFAPSILIDHAEDWFELKCQSEYMQFVSEVKKDLRIIDTSKNFRKGIKEMEKPKSIIPAVTHVDYTARIQTVDKRTNNIYERLISEFYNLTKCPLLVNTSFNIRGEPIVCSPEDAYRCFMQTEIDILVINNFILKKVN